MKQICISFAFLVLCMIATAQDACLNDLINTTEKTISALPVMCRI